MSETETSHTATPRTAATQTEGQAVAAERRLKSRYKLKGPVQVLAATTCVALLGGVMLIRAATWSNPLVGLGGVVVATCAAWVTTDYTAAKWQMDVTGRWKAFVLGAVSFGAVGLWFADDLRSSLDAGAPPLAFFSLMALTLSIGPLATTARNRVATDPDRWMTVGLAVGFFSSILLGSPIPTELRLAALAAMLAAFGLFSGGLSCMCIAGVVPTSGVLRIVPGDARERGMVVGGVGFALLLLGLFFGRGPLVGVGAWLTVVAMIMLSVRPARFGMSTLMEKSVLGAGVMLVAVAGYQLYATDIVGRSGWFVTFLALAIALVGAWIVWRGATLFIVVVLGFAFVWGLFPHADAGAPSIVPAPDTAEYAEARTQGIVAFGDSFMSGEGAPDFYEGTDQKGDQQNECRRAPTAYPVLIAAQVGKPLADLSADGLPPVDGLTEDGLDFFACSGAKVDDLLVLCDSNRMIVVEKEGVRSTKGEDGTIEEAEETQSPEERAEAEQAECDRQARVRNEDRLADFPCAADVVGLLGQYPCSAGSAYGAVLQIENLPDNREDTQLVLLSIGGNDVRFGDIVAGCLLPGSCAERREIWLDNVAALAPELTETYVTIKETFDGVPVVVMPYPLVLTEETCDESPLDESEHEFIYEFTTVLNSQMAASAQQAGVHFFDEGAFALNGRRLCESKERAINLIRLQPTDGPLANRLNPTSWTHNSMHPNPDGHQMIADELVAWLNEKGIVDRTGMFEGSANPPEMSVRAARLLDVRNARPFAVSPEVADVVRSAAPDVCDASLIRNFGTRVAVFDEQSEAAAANAAAMEAAAMDPDGIGADVTAVFDPDAVEAFRVPIAGADPAAQICVTDSSGSWRELTPIEEDAANSGNSPSAAPVAQLSGERLFISGGRPNGSCREIDPNEAAEEIGESEGFPAGYCDFQWVLFRTPQVGDAAPTWSLRAVRYCSVDPGCENTFDDWRDAQIDSALGRVAPVTGLIFLGGWLLALGVELVFAPRLARFFRRDLTGSFVRSSDRVG